METARFGKLPSVELEHAYFGLEYLLLELSLIKQSTADKAYDSLTEWLYGP